MGPELQPSLMRQNTESPFSAQALGGDLYIQSAATVERSLGAAPPIPVAFQG